MGEDLAPRQDFCTGTRTREQNGTREARTLYECQGFRGAVASAHPFASQAGLAVLGEGGHAVDAAIAVNAVLNVTQPDACGVGGDLFALYQGVDGVCLALNASGRSPLAARLDELLAQFAAIPPRSAFAVTVPGCVAGWWALHRRFGRLAWRRLFDEAVTLAEEGFPLTRRVAAVLQTMWEQGWRDDPEARALFYRAAPTAGARLRLPDLAATFRRIAEEGRDGFYRGALARAIAERVRSAGHPLSTEDLAEMEPIWQEPWSSAYRRWEVLTTPPNSQGFTALAMLRVLSETDPSTVSGPLDPTWVERLVEAKRVAYRLRDAFLTDPDFLDEPALRHALGDPQAFGKEQKGWAPGSVPDRDTTAFSVVDGEGNALVVIQSLFHPFGSGIIVPGTGIVLQNRGAAFRLDPQHVNRFRPGCRPAHTLMATLVREGSHPRVLFSTMGADAQPQITVQVLTAHLDFGWPIEEALAAPRFVHDGLRQPPTVCLEARMPSHVFTRLAQDGYHVERLAPYAYQAGHAQAIVCHADGRKTAGSDPRGDGLALCR